MRRVIFVSSVALVAGCGGTSAESGPSTEASRLEIRCEAPEDPADTWRCGEPREVECTDADGTSLGTIHVDGGEACDPEDYSLSAVGPFPPGEHVIAVRQGEETVCESRLRVVDTTPPAVVPRVDLVFPPNHRWLELSAADCAGATDACDPAPVARFTYGTSDEDAEVGGAGHTEVDLEVGCDTARFRAERAGGGDGRVYRFGVEVEDASGNAVTTECVVLIPHDRGANPPVAEVDDGEAQRMPAACP